VHKDFEPFFDLRSSRYGPFVPPVGIIFFPGNLLSRIVTSKRG
jgi:hypothetical protein